MDNQSVELGQSKSLADHIASVGYQTVTEDLSGYPVALQEALAPREDSSSEVINATETAGQVVTPEAQTSAQVPDPFAEQRRVLEDRQAELDRREQSMAAQADQERINMATAAMRREEIAFTQGLEKLDDPAERRAAIAEFRLVRANRERDYYAGQATQVQGESAAAREQAAKNQVIFTVMTNEKIPQEFAPFLQNARTVEEFDQLVTQAKAITAKMAPAPTTQQQARQDRVASGVDVASGNNAGFVPPAEPKERSGDLMGLIKSRDYRVLNVSR